MTSKNIWRQEAGGGDVRADRMVSTSKYRHAAVAGRTTTVSATATAMEAATCIGVSRVRSC